MDRDGLWILDGFWLAGWPAIDAACPQVAARWWLPLVYRLLHVCERTGLLAFRQVFYMAFFILLHLGCARDSAELSSITVMSVASRPTPDDGLSTLGRDNDQF
jgi:hypothetical protein